MFGIGEIAVISGVIVFLFGAKKLPELGKSLGQCIHVFRKAAEGSNNSEKADDK